MVTVTSDMYWLCVVWWHAGVVNAGRAHTTHMKQFVSNSYSLTLLNPKRNLPVNAKSLSRAVQIDFVSAHNEMYVVWNIRQTLMLFTTTFSTLNFPMTKHLLVTCTQCAVLQAYEFSKNRTIVKWQNLLFRYTLDTFGALYFNDRE